MPKLKKNIYKDMKPRGMCPEMTKPKKKPQKRPPKPYRAPRTVQSYYRGIKYGIQLLQEDLGENLTDEDLINLINERARVLKIKTTSALTNLEKEKQKKKMLEWEEKEWEAI